MNCKRAHTPHKFQMRPKTSLKTSTRDSRSHLLLSLEGLPWWLRQKEPICNAGDLGSIPGLGRSPGEGKGYPLQYSGLEDSLNCIVPGVAKIWTRLRDFHLLFTYCYALFLNSRSKCSEADSLKLQDPLSTLSTSSSVSWEPLS